MFGDCPGSGTSWTDCPVAPDSAPLAFTIIKDENSGEANVTFILTPFGVNDPDEDNNRAGT